MKRDDRYFKQLRMMKNTISYSLKTKIHDTLASNQRRNLIKNLCYK